MAVEWIKAKQEVVDIAQDIIDKYHPTLGRARIAFLFRGEAPISGGKSTLGKAAKVNAQWKPLLQDEFDFVIWLAQDWWETASKHQRRALVDHELCHCYMDGFDPVIKPHDIEEFAVIISRYGEWKDDLKDVGRAFRQEPLLSVSSGRQGKLVAVDIPFTANPKVDRETGEILSSSEIASLSLREAAEQMNGLFEDTEVTYTRGGRP